VPWILCGPAVAASFSHLEDPVEWMWSGAVTSTSAVVKAKIKSSSEKVRLLVATDPTFRTYDSIPEKGYVAPDPDGVLAFRLENLEPDTLYHYSVEVEDRRSVHGRLRTFSNGPLSFRVAFASCASTGSNHKIFSTIKNLEPGLFIHMGDFHYENINRNDPRRYRRAFDRVLKAPRQADLFSHVEARTIHQAFSVGRVRFILTDLRAERSPAGQQDGPNKTMLGRHQRDWLERELAAAPANHALVVWVNVVPWITKNARGSDQGWEPYGYERTLIADRIKSLELVDRLVLLSGDAHMVAMDDGTNSNYASDQVPGERAFPVIHAAPLDRYPRKKGGPYSHGSHVRRRFFGLLKEQQFGFMKVQDDGITLEVEFSGLDADGNLLSGMLLKMRCEHSGCRTID
jgi:alkaline phosphatase D